MDTKIIVLLFLFSVTGKAIGQLRCYACSFTSVESDQSCLTITESTNSVDCSFKYCTILRQEFLSKHDDETVMPENSPYNFQRCVEAANLMCDPAGVVASFTRGCDDSPDFLNHEVTDSTFRTFYRACTNDLCNIGNGIQSVVGGGLSPSPDHSGQNLLVPGTGRRT